MAFVAVTTPIVLPWPLQSSLEAMARVLLEPGDRSHIDFSRPVGEAALLSPESVSWRVFKNPLSLFIGGVTAVIMELAEPRVCTGIWESPDGDKHRFVNYHFIVASQSCEENY